MLSNIRIIVLFILLNAASTAHAQVPVGSTLNLTGYVPTLNIGSQSSIVLGTGVEPWWGSYQLPVLPFSLTNPFLAQGIPPNSEYPSVPGIVTQTAVATYPTPYWSGYNNELTAYPNADLGFDISASLGQGGDPIVLDNGVINFIARPLTIAEEESLPAQLKGHTYISGAMNSYPAAQKYGYFEETMKIPSGSGLWSSFWLWPQNMNLPQCVGAASCNPEIDIAEIMGANPKVLNTTIHTSDHGSTSYPAKTDAFTIPAGIDLSQGFHRYGMDWEPDYITFYLDGVAYYSVHTPSDMHQPFFLITGLAVGLPNQWAGAVNSTTPMPATMQVSSLRIWQRSSNISK